MSTNYNVILKVEGKQVNWLVFAKNDYEAVARAVVQLRQEFAGAKIEFVGVKLALV